MIPIRIFQVILLSISYFFLNIISASMTIAILAMIDKNSPDGYNWTTTHISILSNISLFTMYLFMMPCNYLPKVLHYKKITFVAVFGIGISYALIPMCAPVGWWAVCLLRAIGGMMFGAFSPLAFNLTAKWAPVDERTRIGLLLSCGSVIGNFLGSSLSGIIVQRFGWHYVFIIIGSITCLWAFVPTMLMVDSPEKHPNLSNKERALYKSSDKKDTELDFVNPPFLKIITSTAVWSINFATLALETAGIVSIMMLPLFLRDVMKIDIEKTGLISSLPIVVSWIASFPFCYLADYAIKYGLPISIVRKFFTTLALWGRAIALLILCYVEKPSYIIIVIILASFFGAGSYAGSAANHMDLSPNFAGCIHSFTSTMSCPNLIITPLIWAYIVTDTSSASQWHQSFVYSAVFLLFANVFCLIFTKGVPQEWDSTAIQLNKKKNAIEAVITK